ncbi:uncharacterized protein [Epargyreus clarus]|uniref:uncharacterized protein n=1 Tax=Epargyreus clarus TaxID=520877 RepID=UPI003C2CC15B
MWKNAILRILVCFISIKIYVEVYGENTNNMGTLNLNMDNWTSCEDFLANTTFDRTKLIDVDWKIFYFWNYEEDNSYHLKFSIPSRLLTDRFRVELDKEIEPPVNWTEAELFMETSIDFSALYIRTETPGKFRLIPSLAFEVGSTPLLIFGVKYVEPGYLGIMNCKYRICYALAPVQNMPKPEDLKLAAEKIGFNSEYGYSYLVTTERPPPLTPFDRDDAEDDEELDIDEHGFQGNYVDGYNYGDDDD